MWVELQEQVFSCDRIILTLANINFTSGLLILQVGGVQIQTGFDCEPLLLHILHLELSGEGSEREQLVESPHVFPANAEVGTVFTALGTPEGVLLMNSVESTDEECWTAIPQEDMKKTFREQGLRNGSLILVQDSDSDDNR